MTRKTTPIDPAVSSFEQLDQKLLELASCESVIKEEEAKMNQQMQELRDRFETKTAEARAKKEYLEKQISTFCVQQKHEFEKTRSKDLVHGTVGFRYNPPKVVLLNRKYNINTAIELLKRLFADLYVRRKEEINKEAILADYAGKKVNDEQLAGAGLKVDQGEEFFYDIKWDSLDAAAA